MFSPKQPWFFPLHSSVTTVLWVTGPSAHGSHFDTDSLLYLLPAPSQVPFQPILLAAAWFWMHTPVFKSPQCFPFALRVKTALFIVIFRALAGLVPPPPVSWLCSTLPFCFPCDYVSLLPVSRPLYLVRTLLLLESASSLFLLILESQLMCQWTKKTCLSPPCLPSAHLCSCVSSQDNNLPSLMVSEDVLIVYWILLSCPISSITQGSPQDEVTSFGLTFVSITHDRMLGIQKLLIKIHNQQWILKCEYFKWQNYTYNLLVTMIHCWWGMISCVQSPHRLKQWQPSNLKNLDNL